MTGIIIQSAFVTAEWLIVFFGAGLVNSGKAIKAVLLIYLLKK